MEIIVRNTKDSNKIRCNNPQILKNRRETRMEL